MLKCFERFCEPFCEPFLSKEDLKEIKAEQIMEETLMKLGKTACELRNHFLVQKIMQESLTNLAKRIRDDFLAQEIMEETLSNLSETIKRDFFDTV